MTPDYLYAFTKGFLGKLSCGLHKKQDMRSRLMNACPDKRMKTRMRPWRLLVTAHRHARHQFIGHLITWSIKAKKNEPYTRVEYLSMNNLYFMSWPLVRVRHWFRPCQKCWGAERGTQIVWKMPGGLTRVHAPYDCPTFNELCFRRKEWIARASKKPTVRA